MYKTISLGMLLTGSHASYLNYFRAKKAEKTRHFYVNAGKTYGTSKTFNVGHEILSCYMLNGTIPVDRNLLTRQYPRIVNPPYTMPGTVPAVTINAQFLETDAVLDLWDEVRSEVTKRGGLYDQLYPTAFHDANVLVKGTGPHQVLNEYLGMPRSQEDYDNIKDCFVKFYDALRKYHDRAAKGCSPKIFVEVGYQELKIMREQIIRYHALLSKITPPGFASYEKAVAAAEELIKTLVSAMRAHSIGVESDVWVFEKKVNREKFLATKYRKWFDKYSGKGKNAYVWGPDEDPNEIN